MFFRIIWFKFSFVTVVEMRPPLCYNWINSYFRFFLNQKETIREGEIHNLNEWLDRVEAASRAEGMAKGMAKSMAKGTKGMAKGEIIGAIKLYSDEMHLTPVEITGKIMKRFCLEREAAVKYIAEVPGLQPA